LGKKFGKKLTLKKSFSIENDFFVKIFFRGKNFFYKKVFPPKKNLSSFAIKNSDPSRCFFISTRTQLFLRVNHECHVARAFYVHGHCALVFRAVSGHASGQNFAAFRNVFA